MNVEVKEYGKIGLGRRLNIEVYKYNEVKDLKDLKGINPLYKGPIDEAPDNIKDLVYLKCELGNPTIYYV